MKLLKIIGLMKMTAFIVLIASLHASAGSFSQRVSLKAENMPLKVALNKLKEQSGFLFVYSDRVLRLAKPVTTNMRSVQLNVALSTILHDLDLSYSVNGKYIVITPAIPALQVGEDSVFLALGFSFFPVNGRVADSAGAPLSGATIMVKGKNVSAQTDAAGRFTLNAEPGDILVVSYIGYLQQEYKVGDGNTAVLLRLQPAVTQLNEISISVNTGYQVLSRERATGAFSTISGKRFDTKLRPDLKAALEGQAAGVVITKEGNVEIRGVSTMNAGIRDPLIVVDGYPISGGLESINIDNIESVTVLKDAVAASIYGARSSNGVIIIATKQANRGPVQIGYKGSYGVTLKPQLSYLNRASSADYVDAELDLYNQDPNSYLTSYTNYSALSTVNYLSVLRSQNLVTQADYDQQIAQLKTQDGIGQLEKYYFRSRQMQQHNISVSGGGENNVVNAAVKYISNSNNTQYNTDSRLIADFRNDWKLSKRLSVRMLTNVNYARSVAPVRSWSEFLAYNSTSALQPYDLIVNPATGARQDVQFVNQKKIDRYAAIAGLRPMNYNPLDDLPLETTTNTDLQVRMGGSFILQLLPGLSMEGGGTWTKGSGTSRSLYSKNSYRMRIGYNDATSVTNATKHYTPDGDMVNENRNTNEAYMLRLQLNYNRQFGVHRVSALAGQELTRDIVDNNTFPTRFGYNDQAGVFSPFNYADYNAGLYNADMLSGSTKLTAGNGSYAFRDNRFVSSYANASYEYDNRFLVSGSIRLDQTNFFGTDPRYRYKPLWSIGGTYKLSNERFYHISWLDKLYLRGSYGINGNISLNSGPFLIVTAGSYSTLTGGIPYTISSPPNNSLRWEKTNTINLATDLTILKRINLSLDYYFRKSNDLLASNAIDPTRGFASITQNVGSLNNQGIEVSVNTDIVKKRYLVWNVLFNMSYNANKVTEYNFNYQYTSQLTAGAVLKKGHPADAIFAYQYAGLDNNGIAQFYNSAKAKIGGGNVAATELVYAGTLRPKFVYALTNSVRYQRVELSFMFVARTGNVLRKDAFTGSNYINKNVASRWRQPGDEAKTIYPKLTAWNMDMFYFPYSDVLVESASFLKLRDLSLTYDMERGVMKKIGFSGARIYFQARNLFMITANSDKRDPETAEINTSGGTGAFTEQGFTSLPLRPEFYVGLSLGF
jgi:TonB-linked SusC/RagA family outer membrane protein